MFVFVLNQHGTPLMPCSPRKARLLLKQGKAKVVKRCPFQIKLLFGSSAYKQPIVGGLDSAASTIGCATVGNSKVFYQSEVTLRQDLPKKMQRRKNFRRTRRYRKTRYRKPRWRNRASMRREGRLSPTIRSKYESHLREMRQVQKLLPITQWKIEIASFDVHKLKNPQVQGVDYQKGPQKDFYNTKAYVLVRDGYRCRSGRKGKHSPKLHVHHLQPRCEGGSDAPDNLLTLCESCHMDLHRGVFSLPKRRRKCTKAATQVSVLSSLLRKSGFPFDETFGYETKYKREQFLKLPKTHYHDAVAICCEEGEVPQELGYVYFKRHVASGDYQQTKGRHSQQTLPTGKLFGLRKYDLVETNKGTGFVKGKRSTGYFSLMDIHGKVIHDSVRVKENCRRLAARSTTILMALLK